MSEADMHNEPPLPDPKKSVRAIPSQPTDAPAAWIDMTESPFNSPESEVEDWQTVNFPNAISIDEIEDDAQDSEAPEPVGRGEQIAASKQDASLCALASQSSEQEPSSEVSANVPQIAELVTLIQQLRQRNNELTHRVAKLDNALHECQTALKIHTERSRTQESLLAQRTKELAAAQAQTNRLTRELEAAHQQAQRQHNLIASLTEQLETSQYRLAQIERECALTQQRYTQQAHQIWLAETTCRDLRSRLLRQQRHTLQFKAALEKCLETPEAQNKSPQDKTAPTVGANVQAEAPASAIANLQELLESPTVVPKTQPIQPWAAQFPLSASDKQNDIEPKESDLAPSPPPTASQPAESQPTPPAVASDIYIATPSHSDEALKATSAANTAVDPLWAELTQLIDTATATFQPSSPPDGKLPASGEPAATKPPAPALQPPEQVSNKPAIISEVISPDSPSWPAPLVYPQQAAKKRQSLAAIDLPSFPRLK